MKTRQTNPKHMNPEEQRQYLDSYIAKAWGFIEKARVSPEAMDYIRTECVGATVDAIIGYNGKGPKALVGILKGAETVLERRDDPNLTTIIGGCEFPSGYTPAEIEVYAMLGAEEQRVIPAFQGEMRTKRSTQGNITRALNSARESVYGRRQ